MNIRLSKKEIERYSRQIILKNFSNIGQKKIKQAKILIIGVGGLGCSVAEFLTRAGAGLIGLVDDDKVSLSNLHRQSLFNENDLGKLKVICAKNKLNKINGNTKLNTYKLRLNNLNAYKLIQKYDFIVDGSDNFKTKFLINDFSLKLKKYLVVGAINKFDGHILTYNFKIKKTPCLRCFFQENIVSDDILNCEYEGVLGTIASIIGTLQANEILKQILGIGKNLNNKILILDLLNLKFRKAEIQKRKKCIC